MATWWRFIRTQVLLLMTSFIMLGLSSCLGIGAGCDESGINEMFRPVIWANPRLSTRTRGFSIWQKLHMKLSKKIQRSKQRFHH